MLSMHKHRFELNNMYLVHKHGNTNWYIMKVNFSVCPPVTQLLYPGAAIMSNFLKVFKMLPILTMDNETLTLFLAFPNPNVSSQ